MRSIQIVDMFIYLFIYVFILLFIYLFIYLFNTDYMYIVNRLAMRIYI